MSIHFKFDIDPVLSFLLYRSLIGFLLLKLGITFMNVMKRSMFGMAEFVLHLMLMYYLIVSMSK